MVIAIVTCEVGFWVLIAGGLALRYGVGLRRTSGAVLACVPVVDVVLLALTVVDLRSGNRAEWSHGLAAAYLGFSVVFGPAMVRWADRQWVQRFGGADRPPGRAQPHGSVARMRQEWREFGKAGLAVMISYGLLLAAIRLAGSGDTSALSAWFPQLGLVLVVWFVGWPLIETARAAWSHNQ